MEYIFLCDVVFCESHWLCVLFENQDEAIAYLKDDCIYRYDQSFFNQAESIMETENALDKVIELARKYYSLERTDTPLIEVLSDGKNRILREIPIK